MELLIQNLAVPGGREEGMIQVQNQDETIPSQDALQALIPAVKNASDTCLSMTHTQDFWLYSQVASSAAEIHDVRTAKSATSEALPSEWM